MAFLPGNNLGTRPRLFDAALKRAIAQDDGKKIRECAEKLLTLASEGEPWAVKELADRLDGKCHQSTSVSNEDGTPLLTGVILKFIVPNVAIADASDS